MATATAIVITASSNGIVAKKKSKFGCSNAWSWLATQIPQEPQCSFQHTDQWQHRHKIDAEGLVFEDFTTPGEVSRRELCL